METYGKTVLDIMTPLHVRLLQTSIESLRDFIHC